MRFKVVLPVIAAILAYALYIYSLPAPRVADSAVRTAAARLTREISIDAIEVYIVCAGEYADSTLARIHAARLAQRGAAAYIREENDLFSIVISAYLTDGEARSICRRLKENEDITATSRGVYAQALRLRITADESQLAAIETALNIIRKSPETFDEIAYGLDGGKIDSVTARSLAALTKSEIDAALMLINNCLSDTRDEFCTGVIELTREIHASLSDICDRNGPRGLLLSSHLKQVSLQTRLGLIDIIEKTD